MQDITVMLDWHSCYRPSNRFLQLYDGLCLQIDILPFFLFLEHMNIAEHNRKAWEHECENGNVWTLPVSHEVIASARSGKPHLLLTPKKEVPQTWYGQVRGKKVLCLASGGGQQTPQFAAMGAEVTVFDNCQSQLDKDMLVCTRERLSCRTVLGDMRDLSCFPDSSFSLVFHPVSNCFVDDILVVWRECHRVLEAGGVLLAGVQNPATYMFADGTADAVHKIPYTDFDDPAIREERLKNEDTLEFSHTLEEQFGGICDAGFSITGCYTDQYDDDPGCKLLHDAFIAIRAKA
jgi:SAM-dependent methyltransferase